MAWALVTTTASATRPALRASAATASIASRRASSRCSAAAAVDLGRELAREALELELLEEGVGGRPVGLLARERLEVELDRERRCAASRAASRGGRPPRWLFSPSR